MPYPIPTDHERRALFGWLKQASSLTAWRRLYSHHQVFVDAVAKAYVDEQSTPGMKLTIPTDWYADVLRSHDAFYAALERLARGDRRCFTYLGASGHFSQGLLHVEWWQDMYYGGFVGRNGFEPENSPHWPEIEKAMHQCLAALSDISVVLQPRGMDAPAPISEMGDYYSLPASSLIKHWASQSVLPAVPSAVVPEVLVATGKMIPCYGIWEPVRMGRRADAGRTSGGQTYALADSREVDGRSLDGYMNYLHADFAAPTIEFEEDGPRNDGRPAMWRLVWGDDRYGEKPIPEEETQYVFVQPVLGEVLFKYSGVPRPL